MDFYGDYLLIDQFSCDHPASRRLPCDEHDAGCTCQILVCTECGEPLPDPEPAPPGED